MRIQPPTCPQCGEDVAIVVHTAIATVDVAAGPDSEDDEFLPAGSTDYREDAPLTGEDGRTLVACADGHEFWASINTEPCETAPAHAHRLRQIVVIPVGPDGAPMVAVWMSRELARDAVRSLAAAAVAIDHLGVPTPGRDPDVEADRFRALADVLERSTSD